MKNVAQRASKCQIPFEDQKKKAKSEYFNALNMSKSFATTKCDLVKKAKDCATPGRKHWRHHMMGELHAWWRQLEWQSNQRGGIILNLPWFISHAVRLKPENALSQLDIS